MSGWRALHVPSDCTALTEAAVEFQRDSASLRHKRVRTHPRQQNTNSSCCACRRSALLSSFSSSFFFPSIYLTRQITSEAAALSPQNPADRYAINPNCTKAASNPGRNADKIFESCFILSQREGVKWHAATSRLPQPCKHHPNAWWSKVHVHLMWLKHIDPFSNSIFLLSGGNLASLVFHVGCLDWMDRFHLLIPKREISHLRRVARSNVFFRSLDWFIRITQEANKNKNVNLKNSNAVNSPARTLWLHLAEIKLRLCWHDYMFGKQFLRSAANEISQGCFFFFLFSWGGG